MPSRDPGDGESPEAPGRQRVHLFPADEVISQGVCSLCGRRSVRIGWTLSFHLLDRPETDEDNPKFDGLCERCASTLNEVAEIAFGDAMRGTIELQAPVPYRGIFDTSEVLSLFVYGTLTDPAIRARVLGARERVSARPARLAGYRRLTIPGFEYPVIAVGEPDDRVEGQILDGLTADDFAALDAYEDVDEGLYARVRVDIDTGDGDTDDEPVVAWEYVRGPALGG